MAETVARSQDQQQQQQQQPEQISIAPLLQRIAYPVHSDINVEPTEIASAFALIFENRVSQIQFAAFLTLLHSTKLDKNPEVLSLCAQRMREAAFQVDRKTLKRVIRQNSRIIGNYRGGLCDIVGTGGDNHSTFNISTTSSIISSPLLKLAKHGNRAQTSMSGAADVLNAIRPKNPNLDAISASNLIKLYEKANYAFLFAPNFHPGMKHAGALRRGLGIRTIFNLLGPLANPVDWAIEARVVGVAYRELGPIFSRTLRLSGAKKAMVVCGAEDLDEISCAGETYCWVLKELPNPDFKGPSEQTEVEADEQETSDDDAPQITICSEEHFLLNPGDFGLPTHPLSEVYGGKKPNENATKLMSILRNELAPDDPILHFVLMNTAALLTVTGICEADHSEFGGEVIKERGPGGMRWKEGLRRARWCIESGRALEEFQNFIELSNQL